MALIPIQVLAIAVSPPMAEAVVAVPSGALFALAWLVPLVISLVGILAHHDRTRHSAPGSRRLGDAPRPRRLEPRFARGT